MKKKKSIRKKSSEEIAVDKILKEIKENTPVASSYQIDNLLRFLNDVHIPQDIINILNLQVNKKNLKIANDIIIHKYENGPYFRLLDLKKVPSLDLKSLQILLDNAKYQMVRTPSFYNPILNTRANFLNFLKNSILFNLRFSEIPDPWESMGDLMILLDFKKSLLERKERVARNNLKAEEKSLRIAQQGGAPANVIQNAQDAVDDAQERVDEIEREADELNKKIDDGDLEGFWDIVKANIEAHIENLRRRERQLQQEIRSAAAQGDADRVEELQNELDDVTEDRNDYQESLDSTDQAVNSALND